MSGRIRTIKPEVLDDEVAASLSDAAWRLWISSWVLADDHGNVRAGAKYLAAQVWQDTRRDAETPLAELIEQRLVQPYAVEGQRYMHVRGWEKHQRVDNAGKPRVPGPSADDGTWELSPPPSRSSGARTSQTRNADARDSEPPLQSSQLVSEAVLSNSVELGAVSPRAMGVTPESLRDPEGLPKLSPLRARAPSPTTDHRPPTTDQRPESAAGAAGGGGSSGVDVGPTGRGKPRLADEVWSHWLVAKKRVKPRSRALALDPKDRKLIDAMLKRGVDVADACRAIDAYFRDPFYLGDNDREREFIGMQYVTKRIDHWLEQADAHDAKVGAPASVARPTGGDGDTQPSMSWPPLEDLRIQPPPGVELSDEPTPCTPEELEGYLAGLRETVGKPKLDKLASVRRPEPDEEPSPEFVEAWEERKREQLDRARKHWGIK